MRRVRNKEFLGVLDQRRVSVSLGTFPPATSAFGHVRVIMILMGGCYNGGCVDERAAELTTPEKKIVVPPRTTDREGWEIDQLALALKDKIVDCIFTSGHTVNSRKLQQFFLPLRI